MVSEEKDTTVDNTQDASGASEVRAPKSRRRPLLTGALVVAFVVVFIAAPMYLALQPKFMQRYTHFSGHYESWATSVHAKVACQRCHVAPTWTAQSVYAVRMLGEFYLSLVSPSRQPKLFPLPTNAACRSCHNDLRTISPSGDLNIPHRAHVDVLKMPCVQCHAALVHRKNPQGNHKPSMATCLKCHDGKQAKSECSACHTNKNLPLNHRAANWVVIHPEMQTKIDCKACHQWTANWCSECHAKRPKSHGANWRTTHGQVVKVHRNCEACHVGAFCAKCHGTVPQANFNPDLKLVR
jgi:hypothetical protein